MAKRVLSIEVGMQQTRICDMDNVKNNPKVYSCVTIDTPEGTVDDGFINDVSKLSSALRDALDRNHITTKEVVFSVSSTKIANREVTIPMVKDNKIMQVITASASDYFPVDISDYCLSYTIQQRINTKTEKQLVLMLLAAPNNLIRGYYSVARDMRLHVTAIDYSGNSLFQIIRKQVRKGVNMSLQINEQTTLINIIEDDKLILQRIMPYGTSSMIDTVKEHSVFGADTDKAAMELLCREKMLNMHFNEGPATEMTGLESMSDSYGKAMLEQKGHEEITESLSFLVDSFTRVLDYYSSRNPDKRIKEVILAGCGANVRGIEELLRNEIGMDMRRLNSVYGVVFTRKSNVRDVEQAEYITCVGAIMAPVGFTVQDVTNTVVRDGSSGPYAAGMFAAIFLAAAAWAGTAFWVQSAQNEQDNLNGQIQMYAGIEEKFAQRDAKKVQADTVDEMYEMTITHNDKYNQLLEELEKHLPTSAVVETLSLAEETITFSVTANEKLLSVPTLIMELNKIPMIRDVMVDSVAVGTTNKKSQTLTYTVNCNYRGSVSQYRSGIKLGESASDDTDDTTAADGTTADTAPTDTTAVDGTTADAVPADTTATDGTVPQ